MPLWLRRGRLKALRAHHLEAVGDSVGPELPAGLNKGLVTARPASDTFACRVEGADAAALRSGRVGGYGKSLA